MESKDTKDKITIKVKIAGEDYHDLVIDWSDSEDLGRQVFKQLASIIGIPFYKTELLVIEFDPDQYSICFRNKKIRSPLEYDVLARLKNLNDGDCFAVNMSFADYQPPFRVNLLLLDRSSFDDKLCTPRYCQHINSRAFYNRRTAIIKNGEPIWRDHHTEHQMSTLRSMGVQPYIAPLCSFLPPLSRSFPKSHYYPIYSRTHG